MRYSAMSLSTLCFIYLLVAFPIHVSALDNCDHDGGNGSSENHNGGVASSGNGQNQLHQGNQASRSSDSSSAAAGNSNSRQADSSAAVNPPSNPNQQPSQSGGNSNSRQSDSSAAVNPPSNPNQQPSPSSGNPPSNSNQTEPSVVASSLNPSQSTSPQVKPAVPSQEESSVAANSLNLNQPNPSVGSPSNSNQSDSSQPDSSPPQLSASQQPASNSSQNDGDGASPASSVIESASTQINENTTLLEKITKTTTVSMSRNTKVVLNFIQQSDFASHKKILKKIKRKKIANHTQLYKEFFKKSPGIVLALKYIKRHVKEARAAGASEQKKSFVYSKNVQVYLNKIVQLIANLTVECGCSENSSDNSGVKDETNVIKSLSFSDLVSYMTSICESYSGSSSSDILGPPSSIDPSSLLTSNSTNGNVGVGGDNSSASGDSSAGVGRETNQSGQNNPNGQNNQNGQSNEDGQDIEVTIDGSSTSKSSYSYSSNSTSTYSKYLSIVKIFYESDETYIKESSNSNRSVIDYNEMGVHSEDDSEEEEKESGEGPKHSSKQHGGRNHSSGQQENDDDSDDDDEDDDESNNKSCEKTTPSAPGNVTEKPPTKCCKGGIWSKWSLIKETCSDLCGACGITKFERHCLSAEDGCPCKGKTVKKAKCNVIPCEYPRVACCPGFKAIASEPQIICGPQPMRLDKRPARVCKGKGYKALLAIKNASPVNKGNVVSAGAGAGDAMAVRGEGIDKEKAALKNKASTTGNKGLKNPKAKGKDLTDKTGLLAAGKVAN